MPASVLVANPVAILFHADCLDGFGAAYAAWRRFGNTARYFPMHHGETWKPDEIDGRDVYILDFSFAPDALEQMAPRANSVTQIDHHASALKAWGNHLTAQANGDHTFRHPTLPLSILFNLEKSGASLAWEHFQQGCPIPLTLRHIEDQDLWRFVLPDTRSFCRALRLLPFTFDAWDALISSSIDGSGTSYQEMLATGSAIERFLDIEIARLTEGRLPMPARLRGEPIDALQAMRHGLPILTDGEQSWRAIDGLAINANALFASELGNRLAKQCTTFALVWQLAADGEVRASLRSKGDFDVSVIACRYNGGGHRNAAGFRMPAAEFMTSVLGIRA